SHTGITSLVCKCTFEFFSQNTSICCWVKARRCILVSCKAALYQATVNESDSSYDNLGAHPNCSFARVQSSCNILLSSYSLRVKLIILSMLMFLSHRRIISSVIVLTVTSELLNGPKFHPVEYVAG